jgi:PAS domain S-box-containing protein
LKTILSTPFRLFLLIIFLLPVLTPFGNAQTSPSMRVGATASKSTTQYVYDLWDVEKGLPQNSIQAMGQSSDGYLWLGTQAGLARFDGLHFTLYRNSKHLANQVLAIKSIQISRDGSVWAGTQGGLNRLKDGVFSIYTTESGLPNNFVTTLYEDRDGALWAGTISGAVRFQNNRFIQTTTDRTLAQENIRAIHQTRDGAMWFGGFRGLSRLKNGEVRRFDANDGLNVQDVHCLYEDRQGSLWIGAEYGGVYRIQGEKITKVPTGVASPLLAIHDFEEDQDGRLWIATSSGIQYFDDQKIVNYMDKGAPIGGVVLCLLRDREDSLWMGSLTEGLYRMRKPRFSVLGAPEGLTNDVALVVLEARDGAVWIGAHQKGLNRLKNGVLESWATGRGLPNDSITALHETKNGDLWIGTRVGVFQGRNGSFRNYSTANGLVNDYIKVIAEDSTGAIWIGTTQGVSRFKDGSFDNSWTREGLEKSIVSDLIVTRDDSVWIATTTAGLYRIKNGELKNFNREHGLPVPHVLSLREDSQGELWIGLGNGDLTRFRDGRFTTYTAHQTQLGNEIYAILEDDLQHLWFTSSHGVYRIARSQFDELDSGRIKQARTEIFGVTDGMRSSDCVGAMQPSGWKTRDGRLLIPTIKGVVTIDPNRLHSTSTTQSAMPVVIEEILADNEPMTLRPQPIIGPDVNVLEIRYSGLNLLMAPKIRFRYMLEGLEKEWNDVGTRRAAYYHHLPPGKYRFLVKAGGGDGGWGNSPASIQFEIKPFFYQTWWFYGLAILAVGALIFSIQKYRISHANEEYLNEIAMLLPTAMMVIEKDGRVKMANHKYVESFGYRLDETPTIWDWFDHAYPDKEYRNANKQLWNNIAEGGFQLGKNREIVDRRVTCKDGSLRDVELHLTQLRDQLIATWTDVTEHKQIQEALRQSEERYRTVIEDMTDSLWELDLQGNLSFFNRQVTTELKRSREELLTMMSTRQWPLMDEENAAKLRALLRGMLKSGEPCRNVNLDMIRGDGEKHSIESNISLIRNAEGKTIGFRGVSRDVTQRLKAEKDLQHAKEIAEAATRAKSEFLANMSHEIRTPMNGILGMTMLALDTELSPEQREYLTMIRLSADSLLTVINDILDFSKIEAGKLILNAESFDLRECIEGAVKSLAIKAQQKALQLTFQIQTDAPRLVIGDAGRLRQVLINLLGNAVKFTDWGEVALEVSVESPAPQTPENSVRLHFIVRDTGIGVPESKQAGIFEAFTQADGSTTRQYGGTGLGLAICSQLVSLMNGRIWLEREAKKGSVFHFTASFEVKHDNQAEESSVRPVPAAVASIADRSLRVLLAEDNLVNQRLATRLLEKRGHQVTLACNGKEAIEAIEFNEFDLALLDIQMPEKSGLEVTEWIRSRERVTEAHLPIIAMTAYAMKGDREQCIEAGMDGYVTKPIHPSELFQAIADVLSAVEAAGRSAQSLSSTYDQAPSGGDEARVEHIPRS